MAQGKFFMLFGIRKSNGVTETRKVTGAGDETRTRDINLGKVALYQLSYTRVWF